MNTLTRWNLGEIVDICQRILENENNPRKTLRQIAEILSGNSDPLPQFLTHSITNDIDLHFVELLDQIVFEMNSNEPADRIVGDYIFEDLHLRLTIYIEIYSNTELYRRNLETRSLTHDDTIIIRTLRISEAIPALMESFDENTHLQKAILRALLVFEDEELYRMYQQIARDEYNCVELKVLALVGLKKSNSIYCNWDLIKSDDPALNEMYQYVRHFNAKTITANDYPSNICAMVFLLTWFDTSLHDINTTALIWLLEQVAVTDVSNLDNSTYLTIMTTITSILNGVELKKLKRASRSSRGLVALVHTLNLLPSELFERVSVNLNEMGNAFRKSLEAFFSSPQGAGHTDDSNVANFLNWQSTSFFR